MASSPALFPSIARRLPSRTEVLQLFGVVLFAVFGWSIRGFLFKLPSFSLYFGLGANFAILCYMFAFALLESLVVMGLLLVMSAALPARWLARGFAYKGFVIVLVAAAAFMLLDMYYKPAFLKDILAGYTYPYPPFIAGIVVSILLLAALLWLVHARPKLQKYILVAVDQLSLFTYIYVPLGLIGLLVVVIRNLP